MDIGALDSLLKELTTGHEETREAAALSLGRHGEAAVEALAAVLDSPDTDARWWAVRALAEAGGDRAVALLVGALEDPDPDVRACAALALGHLSDCTAASLLAACLADESPFVASIAADALSMIGEGAIGALVGVLEQNSAHGRLLAVRALGRIKSQHAIGPLLRALEDSSYLVRFYAREALEELGMGMVFLKP